MTTLNDPAPSYVRRLYRLLLGSYYYSGMAWAHLRAGAQAQSCTILLYHGVSPSREQDSELAAGLFVSAEEFERQMRFLKRHFTIVPLREAVSHIQSGTPFPSRAAAVTFDDGYRNNAEQAFPLLQSLGIPFTMFVATDFIGGRSTVWWDRLESIVNGYAQQGEVTLSLASGRHRFDLSTPGDRRRLYLHGQSVIVSSPSQEEPFLGYLEQELGVPNGTNGTKAFMGWEELQALAASPLVEIGAHSASHANLARLPVESARREISASKEALEAAWGQPVTSFAYPFGQKSTYNQETISLLKQTGFTCAVTGIEGKTNINADLFQLRRVPIQGDDSWPVFVGKVAGISGAIRSLWRTVGATER